MRSVNAACAARNVSIRSSSVTRASSAQDEDDGMQDQLDACPHHRAVDADELQVAAEKQFQLAGGLGGVPPLDSAGDQAGQVVVEVVGDGPGARLHHALHA